MNGAGKVAQYAARKLDGERAWEDAADELGSTREIGMSALDGAGSTGGQLGMLASTEEGAGIVSL